MEPSAVLAELDDLRAADADRRQEGWTKRAFMHAFDAGETVRAVGAEAHARFLDTSGLGGAVYPSIVGMERDLVEAAGALLGAPDGFCGRIAPGGSEAVVLAVRAARDHARRIRGLDGPLEIVAPETVHPSFAKAADLLGMTLIKVAAMGDLAADPTAMADAVSERTALLVASAPTYWHGVWDDIETLGRVAAERGVWLHVDACMGGLLAPFARRAGAAVPPFDLSVSGVTSLTADFHKYGYAPKAATVLLVRDAERDGFVGFDFADGRSGYATPTIAATRSGGPVAGAWAVMRHLGEDGYVRLARQVFEAHGALVGGIGAIAGLEVWGRPQLCILSFGSREIDIAAVGAGLRARGWHPNVYGEPDAIHLRLSPAHAETVPAFLDDLAAATAEVRAGRRGRDGARGGY